MAQVSQFKAVGREAPDTGGPGSNAAVLAELREQLEALKKAVAEGAEHSAKQVKDTVQAGTEGLRSEIQRAPLVSVGIAIAAGALVAIAVTHKSRPEPWPKRTYDDALAKLDQYRYALAESDFDDLTAGARRFAHAARNRASGIVPSLEDVAAQFSKMEPEALKPAWNRAVDLASNLWSAVNSKFKA